MKDETLIEPFAAPEIFVDGFTNFMVRNGNVSCTGYRVQEANGRLLKVGVVRLIFPKDNLPASIEEAQSAAAEAEAPPAEPRLWLRKAH